MTIHVHYDEIYSDWMSKMPTENLFFEFITFNPLQNKITNDNIYILDSNKNYDIKSNNIISIIIRLLIIMEILHLNYIIIFKKYIYSFITNLLQRKI